MVGGGARLARCCVLLPYYGVQRAISVFRLCEFNSVISVQGCGEENWWDGEGYELVT